jgi:molybdopterin biosynthesis enzyme
MVSDPDTPQRIARLTPINDVLARIDALVAPLEPRPMALALALNRVLAQDAVVSGDLPASARALRDGFAVRSDMTADAGAYAPSPLAAPPMRLDVGDPLPGDADAVAPLDAVVEKSGRWEVLAPVTPGEGVLAAGATRRCARWRVSAGSRCTASRCRRARRRPSATSARGRFCSSPAASMRRSRCGSCSDDAS